MVSVDGRHLTRGQYAAVIVSGILSASAPLQTAVGDEVEFDFSSQPQDIGGGALAIAPTFIQGGIVVGKIVDAAGTTLISDTVPCRIRRR